MGKFQMFLVWALAFGGAWAGSQVDTILWVMWDVVKTIYNTCKAAGVVL